MRHSLPYGFSATLELDLASARVDDCARPRGTPLADPTAAVISALAAPLDYPPLAAATVPGDHVAIAVEPGLHQVEQLVAGAIQSLVEIGKEPREISLVIGSNLRPPLALVPKAMRQDLRVILHNPADQDSLQYLAADHDARPIYLNRALCEADLVLPMTTARLTGSLGFVGSYGGLFPTFANVEAQQRFQAPSATDHSVQQRKRREEADQAAWMLGVHFSLQIVPGAGDEILQVFAGRAQTVMRQAQQGHDHAWLNTLPQKASMTIAAIDGGDDQQTWENLARALHAAMQATADGGVIALLTELKTPPGSAIARVASAYDTDTLAEELEQEHTPDAHAAAMLAEARERFEVYFLSGLEGDLVEGLGVGAVHDPRQIIKIASTQRSIVLLGSAQFAGCEVPVLV
jgi:hypothetical protein